MWQTPTRTTSSSSQSKMSHLFPQRKRKTPTEVENKSEFERKDTIVGLFMQKKYEQSYFTSEPPGAVAVPPPYSRAPIADAGKIILCVPSSNRLIHKLSSEA